MRDNVKQFVALMTEAFDFPAPIVDVGALQTEGQEAYADLRPSFGERLYLGSDMRPGQGVDCLADGHQLPFKDGTIGTLLLLDTLEHVIDPFAALREVSRVLRPGGVVMISSHMNFPIHAFPSDYWRFTPMAFDQLLAALNERYIFVQGDAEFPHTVIGVAMHAPEPDVDDAAFRAAVREVRGRWPEEVYGGPLLVWQPATITVAQRQAERRLLDLERGRTLEQSFVCGGRGLCRIDVKMSDLGVSNFCHVVFRLREEGEAGREVTAYRLFAYHVIDGAWISIPVPAQEESAGRRYVLALESPDGIPGQAVAVLGSAATAYQEGQLVIDGEPAEGSLCFQVYCQSPSASPPSARAGAPGLAGVQVGGRAGNGRGGELTAKEIAALILRAEERGWDQTRYLATAIREGFDALRADLKDVRTEQHFAEMRLEARLEGGLEELARIQQETLDQSTEAAAIVRGMRRNPLFRLWKRISG